MDNAAALHYKLQEAKQEGIAIGEEKGREERNIEIAKNMLSKNLSVELIVGVTGLSPEQISKLK